MKVSEKLHKAVNGKCPKIKPGTLERVKLKTEVLLKDHLTVIKKPKIEPIEDTEEAELEDEVEEENQSAGLLIRPKSYIFIIDGHSVLLTKYRFGCHFWMVVVDIIRHQHRCKPEILKLLKVCQ